MLKISCVDEHQFKCVFSLCVQGHWISHMSSLFGRICFSTLTLPFVEQSQQPLSGPWWYFSPYFAALTYVQFRSAK